MAEKKKTNKSSFLKYFIICFSIILMMTICIYTWSLYDRLHKRQQTHQSSEWSWWSLSWTSKDTDNLKTSLEIVKEDLHTIYFALLSAVCLLVPRETTSIISAVFLTLAGILTFCYSKTIYNQKKKRRKTTVKAWSNTQNEYIIIKEETDVLMKSKSSKPSGFRNWLMFWRRGQNPAIKAENSTQNGDTNGVPNECYPERMTITESVRYWMLLQLSWQHDPCEKYHTALLVDPLWEITPLMVLSSVITRSLLHPIELFFGGIGKSFRLFFNEIPAQWQPIMLIVIVLVFLLTIVMLCGYRISLPLILKIEPKTPQLCKTKSHIGHDSIDGNSETNKVDIKDKKQIEYSQG
ncbi:CLCC1 [Mytilus coruscus]|uniref:Chloride channel CLIC-like protein 1 n=1 Tax=Mytilus coruscus TaxID=42192 RepID=A0A6J8CZY8_MYTCO|nr:CLCC1 [Mytilus coruscus]